MEVRFVDETEFGFGWIHPEPRFMQRCAHAIAADGRVWVTDAILGDGVVERLRGLGDPAGVVQMLRRHERDTRQFAEQLGVPHYAVPHEAPAGAPFEVRTVLRNRFWNEILLWFPEHRTLVVAEALGTAQYMRAPEDRLAVQPLLRLAPPRPPFEGLQPDHVLVGHGAGVHERAGEALREALATSRSRIPSWVAAGARAHGPWRRRR